MLFYDTCALLELDKEILNDADEFDPIHISSVTLEELENIKTSRNKDENVKSKARKISNLIRQYPNKFEIHLYTNAIEQYLVKSGLPLTDDLKIVATANALNFQKDCTFITLDNNCMVYANKIFNIPTIFPAQQEYYKGYKEVILNTEELAGFYQNVYGLNWNKYSLIPNQYLIIRDFTDGKIIDQYLWNGKEYKEVIWRSIESKMLGEIRPKDAYQRIAFDSINRNQLTVLRGCAGSGKSLIGLGYFFQELDKGNIDKILMFVNPVATKDSCKFGFLPGTLTEKILDSQIGNFLVTKIGDISMVEKLVHDNKLLLVPVADCRGMDTGGLNAGIYITEAQNTTKDMMKLILQRIDDNTKVIIEGDDNTQVDMNSYEGSNNGLRRLSETFRGENYYGEVTLKKCYRGKIADKADQM